MTDQFWQRINSTPAKNKKITIFLFCLLFSAVSWLSIKLSRESAAIVPLEISLNNIPEDVIITSQSDSLLFLSMKSTGIKLMVSRLLGKNELLETDFSNLFLKSQNNNSLYYFTSNQAELRYSMVNDIARSAFTIQPDTVFFAVSKAFSKKVPVRLDSKILFQSGFNIYGKPAIVPDSVLVTGPIYFKDSVDYIMTEPLAAEKVFQNINRTLKLQNPYKGQSLKISPATVEVFINVEEYTEAMAELSLGSDCQSIQGDETKMLFFPDKVTVYYLVALKDDKSIDPNMFRAFVACPDPELSNNFRLRTEIREQPPLVEILRIKPSEVEYILIE